jgi:hypothetical protein
VNGKGTAGMSHLDNGKSTKDLLSMRDFVEFLYKETQCDLHALKELLCVKIEALDKATSLAKENMELRLAGMNEWRQQSKDREETFARKEDAGKVEERVNQLELSKATLEGKASQLSVYISYGIAFIGVILGIVDLILRTK